MSRTNYESDSEFERDVDQVAKVLGAEGKRQLLFSLLRECRGCGQDPSYGSTEYDLKHVRGTFQRAMICKVCERDVPIKRDECMSIGRIVTLWNTTPLTIEGCHV
ncbi:hypothetical protein [Pseudomonas sp. MPR-ANC1]|uniref:hypothetical protein n=1 Tax=Pseudomonas sp. MPR-ANC1 TaxID=2075548 RepID=UPI0011AF9C0C|nr:hypothetical protein [Pseudomonas sp. MPR-ANC1]